eukprot:9458015-Karenia_brevis.AAC.1
MIDPPLKPCSGGSYQICPSLFDEWLGGNKANQEKEGGVDNHAEVGGTAKPTHDLPNPIYLTPYLS